MFFPPGQRPPGPPTLPPAGRICRRAIRRPVSRRGFKRKAAKAVLALLPFVSSARSGIFRRFRFIRDLLPLYGQSFFSKLVTRNLLHKAFCPKLFKIFLYEFLYEPPPCADRRNHRPEFIALFLTGGPFRSARPEGPAHFLHLSDILPQIALYEKRKNALDKKISVDDAGLAANS